MLYLSLLLTVARDGPLVLLFAPVSADLSLGRWEKVGIVGVDGIVGIVRIVEIVGTVGIVVGEIVGKVGIVGIAGVV